MPPAAATISPEMDRAWLEDQARHDPVLHAYALWDLDYAPERVEFRVLREGGTPVAYLLIWHGSAEPMVHWVGSEEAYPLLEALPPRPLVAVVPEAMAERVAQVRSPATCYGIRLMSRPAGSQAKIPANPSVRRLRASDLSRLQEFAARSEEWVRRGYSRRVLLEPPPVPEAIWGAFDGERLVGVASTQVMRSSVWIIGGVYVDPAHRGEGLGRDLAAAAVAEADGVGAHTALYVRDDNLPALRAYERVGFLTVRHRIWVDAGTNRVP